MPPDLNHGKFEFNADKLNLKKIKPQAKLRLSKGLLEQQQLTIDTALAQQYQTSNIIESDQNQRLVNMVKEFLWETREFECEELYSLTTVQGFDNNMTAEKALKIMTLIPKLSQKYQLEIIRPNIDAIIQNNQTPFDNYTESINSPKF